MKIKTLLYGFIPMLAVTLTACSDDDDWAPGEQYDANQVYFLDSAPDSEELDPGSTRTYQFTLEREDATVAATVPLTLSDTEHFEGPTSVEFAAGQKNAEITVSFKGSEESGDYTCTVSIPDGAYSSPYTSLTSALSIKVSVLTWITISDEVTVYDENKNLSSWTCKLLQREGTDIYRLVGFFTNYDFTFQANKNQMEPQNGVYGSYYGYDAWFFSNWYNDSESFKLYVNNGSGMYIDWALLYMGYQYFYPEKNEAYIYLTGYLYAGDAADSDDFTAGVNNYFDLYW